MWKDIVHASVANTRSQELCSRFIHIARFRNVNNFFERSQLLFGGALFWIYVPLLNGSIIHLIPSLNWMATKGKFMKAVGKFIKNDYLSSRSYARNINRKTDKFLSVLFHSHQRKYFAKPESPTRLSKTDNSKNQVMQATSQVCRKQMWCFVLKHTLIERYAKLEEVCYCLPILSIVFSINFYIMVATIDNINNANSTEAGLNDGS